MSASWTPEQTKRLRSYHAQGLSDAEIAVHMPERSRDAIGRKRLALGLAPNLRHGWSADEVEKAKRFQSAGKNYLALANELNISVEAARQMYRDLARGVKRGSKNPRRASGNRQSIFLPSANVRSCHRLKVAVISSIVRHAHANGLGINAAATRLLSMGVA